MSQQKNKYWKWHSMVAVFAVVVSMISAGSVQARPVPVAERPIQGATGEVGVFPLAVTVGVAVVAGAYVFGLWKGKREEERRLEEEERKRQQQGVIPYAMLSASEATLD
jgi:hypothetical protein